jgi:diguanylate cyclase (GGDEF)-like protein
MFTHQINRHILNHGMHDPLTGLLNRYYLEETLFAEMQRVNREQHSLALILLKIDSFDEITKHCNELIKNIFLKKIAAVLTIHFRNYDHIYRFNENEFLILMPMATQTAAEEKAELLRTVIKRLENKIFSVTSSIGIAMYPKNGSDVVYILAAVERALKQAMNCGGDTVVIAGKEHT